MSRGHVPASEKVFSSFLERCVAHVLYRPTPQLRNEGDWAWLGHTRVAFDYLSPARDFPAVGHWHLHSPESSSLPPALHLPLCQHISGLDIYVPQRRMAHHGTGDVLYWFRTGSREAETAQWPRFVQADRALLCSGPPVGPSGQGTCTLSSLVYPVIRGGSTPLSRRVHPRKICAYSGRCSAMVAHVVFLPLDWWTCSAFAVHGPTAMYVVRLTIICPAFCALPADARFACMLEVPRPI